MAGLEIDGHDMSPVLFEHSQSVRHHFAYYRGTQIFALRMGAFKAHFMTKSAYGRDPIETHDRPLIYNLQADPSERFDLGESRPELVTAFENLKVHYLNEVEVAPSRLESRIPKQ